MTDLAPCPFCKDGGKPSIHARGDCVICYGCYATGPTDDFTREKWNTRAESAPQTQSRETELAAIRKANDY